MAQIQISSEDVMAYSKQVDAYANEIRTVFNEIESRMYYVESIWQSPASKYFMEQFQTLNPAMMSYLDTLARFSTYLHQTANLYQDSIACQNLSLEYKALASRPLSSKDPTINERQYRIAKEIMDIANYLSKSASLIESCEHKQSAWKPGKVNLIKYTNLNLVSQLTKQSRYSYGSVRYTKSFKEWNKNYTKPYFHVGANATLLDGEIKSSISARIWKNKKFDPRIVLNAESSLALLSSTVNARIGNSKVYASARATGQVGVAYATCKAAFSRKEQSFEAGVGVAALRGETRCVLNILGAKVTLTAQGSVGSAEANFSYHFSSREWEIGSKLGFIAGLGFKINVSY